MADGAYFRVHHFARQFASPFPLLAVVGAKTSRILEWPDLFNPLRLEFLAAAA